MQYFLGFIHSEQNTYQEVQEKRTSWHFLDTRFVFHIIISIFLCSHSSVVTKFWYICINFLLYQVSVVAFLSTIWYLIGGCFDSFQDTENVSWTWALVWDWMVTFPWIPTLYTGVFSTGLCLWGEVTLTLTSSSAN